VIPLETTENMVEAAGVEPASLSN